MYLGFFRKTKGGALLRLPFNLSSHFHHEKIMEKIKAPVTVVNTEPFANALVVFAKKNAVMLIAALAALVTSFIVPPDAEYIGYFAFLGACCCLCS